MERKANLEEKYKQVGGHSNGLKSNKHTHKTKGKSQDAKAQQGGKPSDSSNWQCVDKYYHKDVILY